MNIQFRATLTKTFLLLILSLFMAACSSTKYSAQSVYEGPSVELYKGACFGTCPIYRVSYYDDGTLLYEGRRFTERLGFHTRKATEEERRALRQNLQNMDWESYEPYYDSRLPDLAMSVIKKGDHTTKFKEEAPKELQVLGKLLEKIADDGSWEKISNFTDEEPPASNELIIKTKDNKDPAEIIKDISFSSLQVKKKISDHMATWLLHYDSQEVSPGQLYLALTSHPDVDMVEFDVQLKLREEE